MQNLTPKCKVLNVFRTCFVSKKRIEEFKFSIGFLNIKNLFFFFQITVKTREMQSNIIKIALFFKNLQKIAHWLGASPPGPVYDTFELD